MSDIKLKPCPYCNGQAEMGYADACYFVYCTHCNTCGAGEVDYGADAEEQAAEAWNALPRRLRWTNETPTEPGWYWYRLNEKDNISMTYVDVYGTVITYYPNLCPDGWTRQNLKNIHGQWAGPIPEPQEQP